MKRLKFIIMILGVCFLMACSSTKKVDKEIITNSPEANNEDSIVNTEEPDATNDKKEESEDELITINYNDEYAIDIQTPAKWIVDKDSLDVGGSAKFNQGAKYPQVDISFSSYQYETFDTCLDSLKSYEKNGTGQVSDYVTEKIGEYNVKYFTVTFYTEPTVYAAIDVFDSCFIKIYIDPSSSDESSVDILKDFVNGIKDIKKVK